MTAIERRHAGVNGIRLAYDEAGRGPLALLVHGWPELAHSWRNQIPALAAAGYRVVAPDMRGYGDSDAPAAVADYTILHLVGDLVGLLDHLGVADAVVIGHDWGAPVAWHAALLRPDRFRAVVAMSVPHTLRPLHAPLETFRRFGHHGFYWLYFQAPGVAESELERDVALSLRKIYHAASGDVPADWHWRAIVPEGGGLLDTTADPAKPPGWLAPEDFARYVAAYKKSGFRGGLNWYRNIDRNWALMAPFGDARIRQPALFIAGERDPTLRIGGRRDRLAAMNDAVPGLRGKILIPGAGHWVQQEAAERVNTALLEFLASLPQASAASAR
jgi:pimeloyl-ACP methyl ester carboxylesterase